MISFEQIAKVNSEINYTPIHGKSYAEVPQRVQAFRKLFPEGFIITDVISHVNGVIVMRSEAGYYKDGEKIILGSGLAYEKETNGNINRTSYIENCETSAVGRALGFIGFGSEASIASANEVRVAMEEQKQMDEGKIPDPRTQIPKAGNLPKVDKAKAGSSVAGSILTSKIAAMQQRMGIETYDQMKTIFTGWVNKLVESGTINPVDWKNLTVETAEDIIAAVEKVFMEEDA